MMRKFDQKNRLVFLVLAIVYRILLRGIYINSFYPTYKYLGFKYKVDNILEMISFALFVIFTIFLNRAHNKKNEMSDYLIWSLYLISFIPFSVMCGCGAFDINFVVANHVYWLFLIIFYRLFSKIKIKKILYFTVNGIDINDRVLGLVGVISILINLFISYHYVGFRIVLDLFDVYSLRAEKSVVFIPSTLKLKNILIV